MINQVMLLIRDTLNDNSISSKRLQKILDKIVFTISQYKQVYDKDASELDLIIEGIESFINILELCSCMEDRGK